MAEDKYYKQVKCPDCTWSQYQDSEPCAMTPCDRCNSTGYIFEPVDEPRSFKNGETFYVETTPKDEGGISWRYLSSPKTEPLGKILGMNITEATKRACQEPTLLDALSFICVWESERVVKQARENEQWETCFKVCLESVLDNFKTESPTDRVEAVKEFLLAYYQADYYPNIRDDYAKEICSLFTISIENPIWDFSIEDETITIDVECQERVERIKGELEMADFYFNCPEYYTKRDFAVIPVETWKAIRDKELK